jgi:hypothetical protein
MRGWVLLVGSMLLGSCGGEASSPDRDPPLPFPGPVALDRIDDPDACLVRELDLERGTVCVLVEANPARDCGCADPARSALHPSYVAEARRQLAERGECDAAGGPPCMEVCVCTVPALSGEAEAACLTNPSASTTAGWCYLDDETSSSVEACPDEAKRRFLFVSTDRAPTPAADATLFVACRGSL